MDSCFRRNDSKIAGMTGDIMALIGDLWAKISLKGGDRFNNEIERSSKKAQNAFGKVGNSVKAAFSKLSGLPALLGSIGIGMFVNDAVGKFRTLQQTVDRLRVAVEQQGGAWEHWGTIYNQIADDVARKTAISKVEITDAQAMLLNYGGTLEDVLQLTPLIADMSVGLSSAGDTQRNMIEIAEEFGKFIKGDTEALNEMVVEVDNLAKEGKDLETVVAVLNERYKGQAELMGKTATGEMEQYRKSIQTLKIEFGELISEGIGPAIPVMTNFITGVKYLLRQFGPEMGELRQYSEMLRLAQVAYMEDATQAHLDEVNAIQAKVDELSIYLGMLEDVREEENDSSLPQKKQVKRKKKPEEVGPSEEELARLRRKEALLNEIARVTEDMMTPMEQLTAKEQRLGELWETGLMPVETYLDAIAALGEEYAALGTDVADVFGYEIPAKTETSKEAFISWGDVSNTTILKMAQGLESGIGSAMSDLVMGTMDLGKTFKRVAAGIIGDISAMIVKMLILKAVNAFFPGMGNILQAGGFMPTPSAKGNAFAGGEIIPFAKGGIVSRPVITPMALMGEVGPEAVMPLGRTASGDLGVKAQAPPVVNNYYTIHTAIDGHEIASRVIEVQRLDERSGIGADGEG
ncbi:MAG: hypothetical protein P9M15_00875 [Candidatus Electryoneaceae bacterium]|nr:hypothetical protein [Candidatus Electryoneaceae bacterium]